MSAAALSSVAQTTGTLDGVTYILSGTTATVQSIASTVTDLNIASPITINGSQYDVVLPSRNSNFTSSLTSVKLSGNITTSSSCNFLFYENANLTTADMSGVTGEMNIGSNWFKGCTALTDVKLPPTCTSIGTNAFQNCSGLGSVDIPNGVTAINSSAFYGCSNLSQIELPANLTTLGSNAFQYCTSLTSISIPAGVSGISSVFSGCTKLASITFAENSKITTINLSNIPLTSLNPPASVKAVTLSGLKKLTAIDLSQCTNLTNASFQNCSALTDVNLPDGLKNLPNNAFSGFTSLVEVEIPASVTTFGTNVFSKCTALKTVGTDGSSWTKIPDNLFNGCAALTGPFNLTNYASSG